MNPELLAAIEGGELTQAQLRQLIDWEAWQLGMTFEEVIERSRFSGEMPRNALGSDIEMLCRMLADD